MTTFRVSLLTIESDNPDPAIMDAVRQLLERSGATTVVMASPAPAAQPKSAASAVAESLMHGSLQELVMDEVTRSPAITLEGLAGAILNDTSKAGVHRVRLAVEPLVSMGRLERSGSGKLYTPAFAATLPTFQRPGKMRPAAPATTCPSFPPCTNCRDSGGECLSLVKRATPVPDAPKSEPVIDDEVAPAVAHEARASARLDDETRTLEPGAEAKSEPSRPLRVHVPQGETMPASDPTGRVEGYPAPSPVAGSLQERIRDAVNAAPGVTIPNLAVSLLGSGSSEAKRKIDFQAGGLVMSGELLRLNGGLYPKGYRGPTVKAAPATNARPTATASNERYYEQILAAYARDNSTSQRELADKLFGESVGHTVAKLQIMLRQLVATERLERLGQGTYRPVGDRGRRGRASEDEDDEGDDTESNGQPDETDELEELDVG